MKTIAISGKGGTGKTTLAALLIRSLLQREAGSVLAVDADPNVNLNDLLGIELRDTVGGIREDMKDAGHSLPGGMTKAQFLEYKIQTSLVESAGFDLIAMGRPEGPGCYCYANSLLRDILNTLSANYSWVVIDNEAGMEHLSRRTVQLIDYLLVVSDVSLRGIRAAGRIGRLLKELDTRITHKYLIMNRVQGEVPLEIRTAIGEEGLELRDSIPYDAALLELEQTEQPVFALDPGSESCRAVERLASSLMME